MPVRVVARLFVFGLLLAASACSSNGSPPADSRIKVVCTTGMIGDLVRNIGGPRVAVTDLFKAGVDPHTYRASTEDLRLLQSAQIVFYNGLHLEGKMGAVLEKLGQKTPSFGIGDALLADTSKSLVLRDGEHSDPHIWFDVQLWRKMADVVEAKLAAFDPPGAAGYRRVADDYRKQLDDLDRETREQLASIPKSQRVLVTSHDAFRYFGRAYDVDVRGIQGVSTESEASVAHINELVDFLSKTKVKAVFVESSVNPRAMTAVMEGCQARGHAVSLGGELFSDAMGDPGTPEGTYLGMIRHNVKTIVKALK